MVKRLGIAAALVLFAAACGGGTKSNAAASKTFTYGAPSSASSSQSAALDSSLADASSQSATLSSSNAATFGDTSSVTATLLGSSTVALMAPANSTESASMKAGRNALVRAIANPAATSGGFDDPNCVVVTATSVTMKSCSVTDTSTSGTVKVTASGSISKTAAGVLTWDIKLGLTLNGTSSSGSVSLTESAHLSGTLTYTSTSLKGSMLTEITASVTSSSGGGSFGVDESVTVDVTFTQGPPSCVTGGTVEAKRVWTQRPNNVTAAQLPDAAAKVTWTGCGTATIAVATN